MLHMFHTYVASVCSKCFIRFIRMLHSSVSCCSESEGAQGVMVAWHGRWVMMGARRAGVGRWGAQRAGVLRTGHTGGSRSGVTRGGVRLCDGANGLESRRTGRAARARRVVWTSGRYDRMVRVQGGNKISARGQVVRTSRCVLALDVWTLVAPVLYTGTATPIKEILCINEALTSSQQKSIYRVVLS
jgi:hypothetical protein